MKRTWVVVLGSFALCTAALTVNGTTPQQSPAQDKPSQSVARSCPTRTLLMNYEVDRDGEPVRQAPIFQLPQSQAFFFVAGMAIDADGAPNAYNADGTGLDDLENAGHPGHWDGILADQLGNPLVQGASDPFPGFYISCTALFDRTKDRL